MAGGCSQHDVVSVTDTADRLRQVRRAYERFLALAAMDCIMDGATRTFFDELACELGPADGGTDREGADRTDARRDADFSGPTWASPFRHGVLDD
jgi:hypothetical protein